MFRAAVLNIRTSVGLLVLLLSACASAPPAPTTESTQASVRGDVFQQAAFKNCELRAFVAWDAARNVLLFHASEKQLLAGPNVGQFQVKLFQEIFAAIDHEGMHDYDQFAARHFLACTGSEGTFGGETEVTKCFAHLEIVMDLRSRMLAGKSEREANAFVKALLTPKKLYPDALIDELTPETFNALGQDGFFELRRSVFESCLRP